MKPKYYILSINNRSSKYTKKVYEVYGELISGKYLYEATGKLLEVPLYVECNSKGEIIL